MRKISKIATLLWIMWCQSYRYVCSLQPLNFSQTIDDGLTRQRRSTKTRNSTESIERNEFRFIFYTFFLLSLSFFYHFLTLNLVACAAMTLVCCAIAVLCCTFMHWTFRAFSSVNRQTFKRKRRSFLSCLNHRESCRVCVCVLCLHRKCLEKLSENSF